MVEFRYGPVEFYLVGFEGERPDQGVVDALADLVDRGFVRLLDFAIVSKSEDGDVTVVEVEEDDDRFGFVDIELAATGIAGDEDIAEFAELIPPGDSAALVAVELTYQRELASRLAASGGVVLASDRVPAPVVNALMDALEDAEEEGE
jgi:uncharacterized membrane protein